jgi:hypothetical protein
MRNDKKNAFWTNVDLFSSTYLQTRVSKNKDFENSTAQNIAEKWRNLKSLWENETLHKILNSSNVNESETEDRLINPILKILGFSSLTKTSLYSKYTKAKSFPDYVLFSKDNDVASALNADDEYKYNNALGILEAKYFNRDLMNTAFDPKKDNRSEKGFPPVQLITYLKDSDLNWGILTNGSQWQIFHGKGQYSSSRYLEFNLNDLLSHPEITFEFALFIYLFSVKAFERDNSHSCRLDKVYDASKKYALEVGPSLFQGCKKSLFAIFDQYQRKSKSQKNIDASKKCYQASLIFLFRIIAIRYLEDRGVLPTLTGKYRKVSLDFLRLELEHNFRSGRSYSTGKTIWNKLCILFKDVNNGTYGIYPGHKGLESDLFEINFDDFFREYPLDDKVLAGCLDLIFRGDGKVRGQIDFYDLGTEKIGDVYNDLLALRLVRKENGDVALLDSDTNKKQLGSYYTHSLLSGTLIEEVVAYYKQKSPDKSKWLQMRFCDNSCGSGHFLRDLIDRLSYELFISEENTRPNPPYKHMSQTDFKRALAQNCVFGIDRDINAVWLTKLSLWLHTAVQGKPFVFIDHHIAHGDSILSRIDPIGEYLNSSEISSLKNNCEFLGRISSESKENVDTSRKILNAIQSICGKAFKDYCKEKINAIPPKERRYFFNYHCVFPEVFQGKESDGFDVILGNPPWETIKPKAPEFYRMITGETKPPKREIIDRWLDSSDKLKREYEVWSSSVKAYAKSLREDSGYEKQAGEVQTYAYFIERSTQSLKQGGMLAYVVKLGLYGDENVKDLRRYLFNDNTLKKLWLFSKNKFNDILLFPKIDPNEKYMMFLAEKKRIGSYIINAKWINRLEDINSQFENWQKYSIPAELDNISRLLIFNNKRQKDICSKILERSVSIEESGLTATQELHQTNDRHLFSSSEKSIPVYTGADLSHFQLSEAKLWLREESDIERFSTATQTRVGVNNILPNSRRKLKAAVIPEGVLTSNSLILITGFTERLTIPFIVGCLNSMLTEYFLRPRLSNINLNNFRLLALPLPLKASDMLRNQIADLSSKLITSRSFEENKTEYKKIEALLGVAYSLTDTEINEYLSFYPETSKQFISDVIGYAAIYREKYKKLLAS